MGHPGGQLAALYSVKVLSTSGVGGNSLCLHSAQRLYWLGESVRQPVAAAAGLH